ncbi:MAG: VWA domain-containing protein [Candidatus Pacearchaeota archaeon]|jgi:Ca-activated chloride channel family protein
MAVFTFTHSQYLFFLFLIPLLFLIHFFSLSNKKKVALRFANFDAISRIRGIDFFSKNIVILSLNVAIVFFLILALSGLTVQVTKESSSFSFVIAIDSSESMLADDFSPNRITVAKDIAREFVDSVPRGVMMGVVSFSGNAYIEQDLTNDKIEIKNSINQIKINGWGGTDLYEAVINSANIFNNEENKAVVVLSDGQINVANLDTIISYAQQKRVLIHTIAIGTEEGGETPYAISKLDKDSLNALAYNTGGKAFLAEDRNALEESLLSILDLTERKVSIDAGNYLILFAIILFSVEIFLINTRYLNIL